MNASNWMRFARRELGNGVAELPGVKNNSPRIMEYLHTTGRWWANDETPWCSAFVNWVLKQAGYRGTNNARASSWLNYGAELIYPARGCIVVLGPNPKRNQAISGHVGFCGGWDEAGIFLLGGNQHNAVSVERYPWTRVRAGGYRWPFDLASRYVA